MRKVIIIIYFVGFSIYAQGEFRLITSIHGEKEGDAFSFVDAIGNVNGDGYDDFIVGRSNSGEYVKLYFGSSPFDTLDCIKFLQGTRKRVFASGCGRGDLNGDGYNDFVINTTYDVNDYRVEVYYGGKDKKNYDNPDLIITNNGWYYYFGGRSILHPKVVRHHRCREKDGCIDTKMSPKGINSANRSVNARCRKFSR